MKNRVYISKQYLKEAMKVIDSEWDDFAITKCEARRVTKKAADLDRKKAAKERTCARKAARGAKRRY